MMCQFEGDIVNSLYDTFLISWGKELANPPGLPCLTTPAVAKRDFYFGDRDAYIRKHPDQANKEPPQADGDAAKADGVEGIIKTMDDTHFTDHATDPIHELREQSERYDKENHMATTIPITERLNVMEKAEQTCFEFDTDFAPFYLHLPHDPVPMALVNRQPQAIPGHHDLYNPQNAAWLQGTLLCIR